MRPQVLDLRDGYLETQTGAVSIPIWTLVWRWQGCLKLFGARGQREEREFEA